VEHVLDLRDDLPHLYFGHSFPLRIAGTAAKSMRTADMAMLCALAQRAQALPMCPAEAGVILLLAFVF
jgi:hypothetical protein